MYSKVGEYVTIAADKSGRDGVWHLIDPISKDHVGMIVRTGSRFLAEDWNTGIMAVGPDLRRAALNLYEKMRLKVTVLSDPQPGNDEPFDFNAL